MTLPYLQLEYDLANWLGTTSDHVVVCSSGTAALHLALEALPIPRKSPIIIPDYTMVACARAATLADLKPTFVDCTDDLLMDPTACADQFYYSYHQSNRYYPHIQAIMVVHVYGRKFDIGLLSTSAKHASRPVYLIEDLAEAHGIKPHPATDAACWSFYKNKIIHGEEGGAVYFRDLSHADKARSLRCMGFTTDHDYTHIPRGHNYRLADSLAQQISLSLTFLPENLARRRQIEQLWDYHVPESWHMPDRDVVWVYDIKLPTTERVVQNNVVKALNEYLNPHGITARHGFKPMTTLQEYAGKVSLNALRYANSIIYLSVNPDKVPTTSVMMDAVYIMEDLVYP